MPRVRPWIVLFATALWCLWGRFTPAPWASGDEFVAERAEPVAFEARADNREDEGSFEVCDDALCPIAALAIAASHDELAVPVRPRIDEGFLVFAQTRARGPPITRCG